MMSLPINKIVCGDCVEVMHRFPDNSIDCIVTDPPYGLKFMGKEWDKALPPREAFTEMYRVLKPGALAFVMSSPRQDLLWRMLAMLEDVGFVLKQSFISWIYKTGFPKAYDVSKGIDKKFRLKRKTVGFKKGQGNIPNDRGKWGLKSNTPVEITEPASKEAKRWEGWKNIAGLKPAQEPILMVYKPLSEKTIVDNVLKWGMGAINVDACRIPINSEVDVVDKTTKRKPRQSPTWRDGSGFKSETNYTASVTSKGRFPANLLVSDKALDTGKITNATQTRKNDGRYKPQEFMFGGSRNPSNSYNDVGDQSRYFDLDAWAQHHGFLDVPKPSKKERNSGLPDNINTHPTVKPVKLMAYLIELGCPPDGVVLDPFAGSGTTLIAAKKLNRKWIGIELNKEYVDIANKRLEQTKPVTTLFP